MNIHLTNEKNSKDNCLKKFELGKKTFDNPVKKM